MTNKRTLADWFLATRPWSYPASTMPVALVLAYYFADGVAVDPVNAVWALVNIVIFHAAGNVWSDYFDFQYGVDNQNTLGVRQLVDGKFVAREFLGFAIFLFAVGTLCALFLVWRTGLPFLAVTFAGIAAALVLSGETTPEILARSEDKPTVVFSDCGELLQQLQAQENNI